jgi:hypothetical protein
MALLSGIAGAVLPLLKGVLTSGKVIQALPDLLKLVTGGNVKGAAAEFLRPKLETQAARTGAKALGRSLCEKVDAVLEAKGSGLTLAERYKLGTALSVNAALQAAEAGELMLKYAETQRDVVACKEGVGPAGLTLDEARRRRNAMAEAVQQGLVDIERVAGGQLPRGTDPTKPASPATGGTPNA